MEKPDRDRATELLASPNGAWWNAGIFVWRRDALLASLERHAPGIVGGIRRGLDNGQSLATIYESLPDVSIDKALLEPASVDGEVKVVPADVGWSDVGSWNALHAELAKRQSSQSGVVPSATRRTWVEGRARPFVGRVGWLSPWAWPIRSSSTHRTSCWCAPPIARRTCARSSTASRRQRRPTTCDHARHTRRPAVQPPIVFGTDGWRARIGEDYTYENVRRCAQGVAEWVQQQGTSAKGVVIGYDRRFSSEYFAAAAAEVLLAYDIPVAMRADAVPDADDLVRGGRAGRRVRRR